MDQIVSVSNRLLDRVKIVGPDSEWFLNGQISADVESIDVGNTCASLALSPQGKVVAWFRLRKSSKDEFDAFVATGFGEQLLNRLKMFAIRTEVDFSCEQLQVVSVRSSSEEAAVSVIEEMGLSNTEAVDCFWPGWFGLDILSSESVPEIGDYPAARISAGIPAMGIEITSDTIPAAAGIVENSVSFTKGCYVGQEQVARIDSRNVKPPTRLVKVRSTITAEVELPVDLYQGETVVGNITSLNFGSSETLGLGFAKRNFQGGSVSIGSPNGPEAEVLDI